MKTADNKVFLIIKTEYKFPIRQEYSATSFKFFGNLDFSSYFSPGI